jgi:predicted ArsR family transcriptional regulator
VSSIESTGEVDAQRWAQLGALTDPVRRRVYEQVDLAGSCTRDQIAARLDLSRSLVTHHLARLEHAGLVVGETEGPTGRAGRPAVLYRTGARPELPGRRYELLALLLATAAAAPTTRLLAAARGHGAAAVPAGGTDRARARTALTALGFAPQPGRGALQSTSCPFLAVSAAHPEVACAVARGLAEGVVSLLPGWTVEEQPGQRCCVRLLAS